MRIVRFVGDDGKPQLANDLTDGRAQLLAGAVFDSSSPLRPTDRIVELPGQLLAPIEPTNIFGIGLNYAGHAGEAGVELPQYPVVFMKPTSTLNHPGGPIRIPACQLDGPETDYECELAVIIGKPARDVSKADALQYVLGYTCGNDVSARRWQHQGGGGQWIRGKGFDTFCPLGPAIVTPDELADPQALSIRTILNGREMQRAHTSDMVFSIATLIEFLSQDVTLLPGTVILTGTPGGIGGTRKPPIWLKNGDQVTIEIESIGSLTNPVIE